MIDVIVMILTGILVYRDAWWNGYNAGSEDALKYQGYKEQYDLEQQRERE